MDDNKRIDFEYKILKHFFDELNGEQINPFEAQEISADIFMQVIHITEDTKAEILKDYKAAPLQVSQQLLAYMSKAAPLFYKNSGKEVDA